MARHVTQVFAEQNAIQMVSDFVTVHQHRLCSALHLGIVIEFSLLSYRNWQYEETKQKFELKHTFQVKCGCFLCKF